MAMEDQGKPEEASKLFLQAWHEKLANNKGDIILC